MLEFCTFPNFGKNLASKVKLWSLLWLNSYMKTPGDSAGKLIFDFHYRGLSVWQAMNVPRVLKSCGANISRFCYRGLAVAGDQTVIRPREEAWGRKKLMNKRAVKLQEGRKDYYSSSAIETSLSYQDRKEKHKVNSNIDVERHLISKSEIHFICQSHILLSRLWEVIDGSNLQNQLQRELHFLFE